MTPMDQIKECEDMLRDSGVKTRGEVQLLPPGHVLFFGKIPAPLRNSSGRWGIGLEIHGKPVPCEDIPVGLQMDVVMRLDMLVIAVEKAQDELLVSMHKTNARLRNYLDVVMDPSLTNEEMFIVNEEWIDGHLPDECKEEGWDDESDQA